ncbi:MAG TPA: hypothetical protein VFK57_21375 [Vicinamibacterales bacterium]|nr:hypothetical protein [Vicinamibacterales bacterium]
MIGGVLHRAAGLVVAADRPLPGFIREPAHATLADLHVHLGTPPSWHGAEASALHSGDRITGSGEPVVVISRSAAGFHLDYADGTRAWIDASGANVWCTWPASASLDDACTYLYGPILGLVLRLRGALAFHASAVQIGGGAIGFVGRHGAGKSTLAAALGAEGCPVITDDVLHVTPDGRRWLAEPFASMLKLWPDGAKMALGKGADLPRIAEGWDKRALVLGERIPAATQSVPLRALACFGEPGKSSAIAPLPAAAALLRLAGNSSASPLLDREQRAAEFQMLSALVRDVPCVTLTPPEDPRDHAVLVQQVLSWSP